MAFDYNETAQEEFKTSKINSAGLINLRMNKLWGASDSCSINADIKKWYLILDTIWGNLAADSQPDDEKIYKKFLDKLIEEGFFESYKEKAGFYVSDEKEVSKHHLHFRILREMQIFLKKIENKQGKGSAYYDALDDDFE